MRVTTRVAGRFDAGSVAELYLRARRAAAAAGTIPMVVHDDDAVRAWVAELVVPKLECWISGSSEQPVVGMLVLDDDWIDQLYVDPDLTGRGIGVELIAVAKRQRPAGLRVVTFVSNTGAQRFYSRHGFREIRRTDGSSTEKHAPDIHYAWRPAPVPPTP